MWGGHDISLKSSNYLQMLNCYFLLGTYFLYTGYFLGKMKD